MRIIDLSRDPRSPEAIAKDALEHELRTARHFFEEYDDLQGKRGLELGCHLGASAIVLDRLGARVDAVEIDPVSLGAAKRNAAHYGSGKNLRFLHVPDTRSLPFYDRTFDFVSCNSVLEYVDPAELHDVVVELDRVLKPGGFIFVLGTSNRLWPIEQHTRGLLTNYLPSVRVHGECPISWPSQ